MKKFGYIMSSGTLNIKKIDNLMERFIQLFNSYNCDVKWLRTDSIMPVITNDGNCQIKGLKKADFILFWDKDIILGGLLERQNFRLFNNCQAIRVCDNKLIMHSCLSGHNIPVPKTIFAPLMYESVSYNTDKLICEVEKQLDYPFIVKEGYGSFGQQVYLVKDKAEAELLIKSLKNKPYLFQQFISESFGKDIRVYVVGGKAVAAMKRVNESDFRANITENTKMTVVKIEREFAELAEKSANVIGLDYCAVDILIGKDEPLLCEVNSNAHFLNIQKIGGTDVADLYVRHILKKIYS